MPVRIYRPARTAMQSGHANTRRWLLEHEPGAARTTDRLMGWTSSSDMRRQVRLEFATREEAIAYAERHGLDYRVEEPHVRRIRPRSYSDNFRSDRVE